MKTVPRCGAFSLIELLVVIAIIATLIGVLLPALSGAMSRARETKCLSNCRQAALVMQSYAGDNKASFPVMPVPSGLSPIENQHIYGGLAGLFSLRQVGNGMQTGFSPGIPGAYSNGRAEPLLRVYLSSLEGLTCPSDREDRYYGFPYGPAGNMSYAAAQPLRPRPIAQEESVISYNISYVYFPGFSADSVIQGWLWGDETNGPDLGSWAWYGDGSSPVGAASANAAAAGAGAIGRYAQVDNHGAQGGNFASADGSAKYHGGPTYFAVPPQPVGVPPVTVID